MIGAIVHLVWDLILLIICICGVASGINSNDAVTAALAGVALGLDGILTVFHAVDLVKVCQKRKVRKADIDH